MCIKPLPTSLPLWIWIICLVLVGLSIGLNVWFAKSYVIKWYHKLCKYACNECCIARYLSRPTDELVYHFRNPADEKSSLELVNIVSQSLPSTEIH